MFSDKITVKVLRPADVRPKVVDDINYLLKHQHGKARGTTRESLTEHMRSSRVVVALHDDVFVVGMGVLVRTHCVSHTFAGIHNLIVRDGYDPSIIGMRIVGILIEGVYDAEFIEAGMWLQTDDMVSVLLALGFRERPKFRYRLKLR